MNKITIKDISMLTESRQQILLSLTNGARPLAYITKITKRPLTTLWYAVEWLMDEKFVTIKMQKISKFYGKDIVMYDLTPRGKKLCNFITKVIK